MSLPAGIGRHRFEAAKRLKWKEINAVELPSTDPTIDNSALSAMAEIAENLHRREITALERSKLRAGWLKLQSDKPKVAEGRPPKGGRQPKDEGIRAASRDLGVPRSTLQQDVKIASLSPEAQEAAMATGLDNNQSALLAAAKHKEPDRQVEAIKQRATAKPVQHQPIFIIYTALIRIKRRFLRQPSSREFLGEASSSD